MSSVSDLSGSYDAAADVLYLQRREGVAVRGLEDENGFVWRYGADGSLVGVTILDFHELWPEQASRIAELISSRFQVSSDAAIGAVARLARLDD